MNEYGKPSGVIFVAGSQLCCDARHCRLWSREAVAGIGQIRFNTYARARCPDDRRQETPSPTLLEV